MNSWTNDFAENASPYINEDRFSVLYSSGTIFRPNTPINFIIEFASDYIESKDNDDLETVITDAGFESAANCQKSKEKNINLVSTDLEGRIPDLAIADI